MTELSVTRWSLEVLCDKRFGGLDGHLSEKFQKIFLRGLAGCSLPLTHAHCTRESQDPHEMDWRAGHRARLRG